MADISFNIACKELKIAQIVQLNQLFKLLNFLVCIYGHGFCELSHMLVKMSKNVNNDVSKDSLIVLCFLYHYMRNFCNLIGLEQWYFSLIWNTYMWKLQTFWT